MEAAVKTRIGMIKVEGDDQADLFKGIASAVEVFNEHACGLCGSEDIVPVVRKNKDEEEFYEFQCRNTDPVEVVDKDGKKTRGWCRAYLYLGQNKKGGGLFPVRALDEQGKPDRATGKYGKHNGWTRYRGEPKTVPAAK